MASNASSPAERLRKITQAIERGHFDAVKIACGLTESIAKQNASNAGRVDRGGLRASIATRIIGTVGYVFVGVDYGVWVELGRSGILKKAKDPRAATAAWPPVTAIRAWVARHYKSFAPSGRTKSGRARPAQTKDVDRVAYLVGRKIYLYGIEPTPILFPAFNAVQRKFPQITYDAIQRRLASIK